MKDWLGEKGEGGEELVRKEGGGDKELVRKEEGKEVKNIKMTCREREGRRLWVWGEGRDKSMGLGRGEG